jgi:formate dehydrogenase subunit delta
VSAPGNDKLIRMANQIATFFASYPEESATASVADHLNQFWSAPMRRGLAESAGGALHPLVAKALPLVRD